MNTIESLNANHARLLERFSHREGEIKIVIKSLQQSGISVVQERHICETFSARDLSIYQSLRGGGSPEQAASYLRGLAPEKPKPSGLLAWVKGLFR